MSRTRVVEPASTSRAPGDPRRSTRAGGVLRATQNNYKTIRELLFERIRSLILSDQYQSGTKLREEELARRFGVSRTPVREALRKLESEGLVKYLPQRGVLVNAISDRDMSEIYTVRAELEGLAARLAAQEISDDEVSQLRASQRQMEEAYTQRNWRKAARIHTQFNMALYAASRNVRLLNILTQFNDYIEHSKTRSLSMPGRAEEIRREHQAMVDAIARRDARAAEMAATLHVQNARRAFFREARVPFEAAVDAYSHSPQASASGEAQGGTLTGPRAG